ncbi:MAG: hypothetical protein KDK39_10125 [Leptospiraceae bacterium]|nr:hypothetical protein [Leptospiraceae bacterium]
MRKKLIVTTLVLAASLIATELSATTYNLFVHGRSGDNHCLAISGTGSATTDKNNYWGGTVYGVSNARYIGFDGTKSGGAYSWSSCGAQSQLHAAMNTFCKNGNSCRIFTHSTGGLVAAYYLYAVGTSGLSIIDIRLMANASGGSELADISTSYLAWLGFDTLGGELDSSVSTSGARAWNHNDTDGRVVDLTSGEASDYLGATSPFLPGEDDGVLANHTLCGINKVATIDSSCPYGTGRIREPYACGFLWLSTCYTNYYRWSNYNTVLLRKSDTHGGAKKHYYR